MSKKIVLAADGTTATVSEAVIGDILTTAISTNEAVTGMYGLAQKAAFLVGGMMIQSKRKQDTFNPL